MSSACGEIHVGRQVNCELLEAKLGVGVFRCCDLATGEIAVIIAQLPDPRNWHDYRPASAITPFKTETQAIDALKHWADTPSLPLSPKKPRSICKRRNSTPSRRHREEADQLQLDL
jgi:hypothetical protein